MTGVPKDKDTYELFPAQWNAVRNAATVEIPRLERAVMTLLRTDFPEDAEGLGDG